MAEFTIDNVTITQKECAKIAGVTQTAISLRIKNGWKGKKILIPRFKRKLLMITINGVTKNIKEWAEIKKISTGTIYKRIGECWEKNDDLFIKPKKSGRVITINNITKNFSDWAKFIGISRQAFYLRFENNWHEKDLLLSKNIKKGKEKITSFFKRKYGLSAEEISNLLGVSISRVYYLNKKDSLEYILKEKKQ